MSTSEQTVAQKPQHWLDVYRNLSNQFGDIAGRFLTFFSLFTALTTGSAKTPIQKVIWAQFLGFISLLLSMILNLWVHVLLDKKKPNRHWLARFIFAQGTLLGIGLTLLVLSYVVLLEAWAA
jgi:hypothetical protein